MNLKSVLLVSTVVFSNAYATPWKIEPVFDHESGITGYTYFVESTEMQATNGNTSQKAKLKFKCSVDAPFAPELAIEWSGMYGTANPMVTTSVDNSAPVTMRWLQTNYNLSRSVVLTIPIVLALKSGKTFSAKWSTNDYVTRSAKFEVGNMSLNLAKFNRLCKSNI